MNNSAWCVHTKLHTNEAAHKTATDGFGGGDGERLCRGLREHSVTCRLRTAARPHDATKHEAGRLTLSGTRVVGAMVAPSISPFGQSKISLGV